MSRLPASARMQRVLAIVPWIAANDGPRIDDVCARFGFNREQLLRDINIASFVGLPPYTADELIELTYDQDRVWVHYPRMFTRPLRLTPEEGLALVAAGAAARALPGADAGGPLSTGLAKVAAVLDVDPHDLDVDLGDAPSEAFTALQHAIASRHTVEIDYYSFGRDDTSHRVIEPWRVWSDQGNWYVSGHCRSAQGERVFRLDRIRSISVLDETFEAPAGVSDAALFAPGPDTPRVTLDLAPSARWVLESYPSESVTERDDDTTRVVLAVTAAPWLERLLLTLGPAATVVDIDPRLGPPEVGADAAERVLRRYRDAVASDDRD
jgi:proteasome accessory factor C